ncbi:hypothetical protein EV384_3462 [Micromonospora kangleipakensis]|uniref:Uncharacterized protein n=1 Tax=Micromonospora kangleipakensis TaxID=1077942 RepID=A0A4Q8BBM1_9ACTN|nr:hypothetical protein EV384_3462 [Micromonospora kangleipakensis]
MTPVPLDPRQHRATNVRAGVMSPHVQPILTRVPVR